MAELIRDLFASGLWRHGDFMRLWIGQTLSKTGTQVSFIALPLAAVLTLDATPIQMGILTAVVGLPSLVVGPFLGVYVDRHRRRTLLITADWARALVIGSVPVAYFLGILTIEWLYAVAFGMGVLGLLFEVSYRSYLPSLVGRGQLVDANSKLELSRSGAEIAGPGIGGPMIQAFGAPVALIVDGLSYVVSALSLHSIRSREVESERPDDQRSLFGDAWRGLGTVWRGRYLRPLVMTAATVVLFSSLYEVVYLLYLIDVLGVSPALIGLIAASGGLGLVFGATTATRIARRFGVGPSILCSILLIGLSDLALPLVAGPMPIVVIVLAVGHVGFGVGSTVWNVNQVSLRQSSTPDQLQGRMNSAFVVATAGSVPLGAMLGGFLGEYAGLRTTLFIGVIGEASAVVWLLASPLVRLRELPVVGGRE